MKTKGIVVFKKTYTNPALGYWADSNKPIEFEEFESLVHYFCDDPLNFQPVKLNSLMLKQKEHRPLEHLCIGGHCLICETAKL
jgi:hypothetical protein